MKVKAAILRATGLPAPYFQSRPLSVEEITLLPPKPSELLVRVTGAGLCHTDLSIIRGNRNRGQLPLALGHEGAGKVVELGSEVHDIKVDDVVVFQFASSCGRCRYCLSGRPQLCEAGARTRAAGEMLAGGSRIRDANGETVLHHSGISCFAEYVVVDRGSVVVIDDSISPEDAAVFGCAVMTGVGALINAAKVQAGESVAIFGLGGVGLCGLMGAAASGALPIIAVDPEPSKRARALECGATHVFDSSDPELVARIVDLTSGGVDVAVELAGAISAMEAAYACTTRGGRVIGAGLTPIGTRFSFEHGDWVINEKSIIGSLMGSCVPVRDVPRFLKMYKAGILPVDRLVDGYVSLNNLNEAFDRLAEGTTMRQVMTPWRDVQLPDLSGLAGAH